MTGRARTSRAKSEPVEEVTDTSTDLVQEYQDKANAILSKVFDDGVERKPWEYANAVGRAQVYATMANTEALRAWYASA